MAGKEGGEVKKIRFVIIGSGWRSLFYVRAAKALPDLFEICAMYCRSSEKAAEIHDKYNIPVTTSEEECISADPDFVVVAVSKSAGPETAIRWMNRGFTVLCETPAALDLETLDHLWTLREQGRKLVIAEQYILYPRYSSLLKLVKSGIIGQVHSLNISLAHEYHGASIIRALLGISVDTAFRVSAKSFAFPVTETRNRYEVIKDGRIAERKRTVSTFEFDNGSAAYYDFDSEQYHSPIRNNSYKLCGIRGEILDGTVSYLDAENNPLESCLKIEDVNVERNIELPDLNIEKEVSGIYFGNKCLYEPVFDLCGLTEDETAVAQMMKLTAEYAAGLADSPYPLKEALQDAYMAILMKKSETSGETVCSDIRAWMH